MSYLKNDVDPVKLASIRETWFTPSNGIIGINEDGENHVKDGRLHLALWAGPSADLFNLFHEMAHFIEIDNRRCHKPGWGLKTGKWVTIAGRYVSEGMFTNKAIEREIRCFAIQTHFHTHYGLTGEDETVKYMAELCKYIDGLLHYYPENWKDDGVDYNEVQEIAYRNIAARIHEAAKQWSMELIAVEWKKKVAVLKRKGLLQ